MSEHTPHPEEPEVEGHLKVAGPEDPAVKGRSGEEEGPEVEGHVKGMRRDERGDPEGPEVEGHVAARGPEDPSVKA
jgi:hypothetical protein